MLSFESYQNTWLVLIGVVQGLNPSPQTLSCSFDLFSVLCLLLSFVNLRNEAATNRSCSLKISRTDGSIENKENNPIALSCPLRSLGHGKFEKKSGGDIPWLDGHHKDLWSLHDFKANEWESTERSQIIHASQCLAQDGN